VKGKIKEVIGDSARDKNIDMIALINQWREIGRHQTMPSIIRYLLSFSINYATRPIIS